MQNVSEAAVIASLCRDSFWDFLKEFWSVVVDDPPVFNWHMRFLCRELQRMAQRVFDGEPKEHDLLINVPPGSSKSTIVSQMFPAWCWTNKPGMKFICASYARDLAIKDSLKTRDLVESELYRACYPSVQMREDVNKNWHFQNTKGGMRLSVGVGGQMTGYHGHFLLVDDPLNPEEASSEAERETVRRWMSETLPTRKVSKENTPLILIQQRLHQMDPSGMLLERGGVRHICLPGELAERAGRRVEVSPPSVLKYYERRGGLLDPVRLSRVALEGLEKDLLAYGYASQILQCPTPLEGGDFETSKIRIVGTPMSNIRRRVRSWDKAGTEGAGKFTVGVLLCEDTDGNWGILDVVRGQWAATRREHMIRQTAELDGPDIPILFEVEGGSGGKESGESTVRNLAGFRAIPYHPTGDKQTRAYPISAQVGAGNVWVLDRPWTKAFIEELHWFPNGQYSDQVDALSGGFNWLARKKRRVGGMGGKGRTVIHRKRGALLRLGR